MPDLKIKSVLFYRRTPPLPADTPALLETTSSGSLPFKKCFSYFGRMVIFYTLLILCPLNEGASLRLYKGTHLPLQREGASWPGTKRRDPNLEGVGKAKEGGFLSWFAGLRLWSHFSVPSSEHAKIHQTCILAEGHVALVGKPQDQVHSTAQRGFTISARGSGLLPPGRRQRSLVGFGTLRMP